MGRRRTWLRWILLTVGILLFVASGAGAQGPEGGAAQPQGVNVQGSVQAAFTYQGMLKENGTPVTGTRDFTFRLFSDDTCTTQVGSDIVVSGVQVTNGVFRATVPVTASDFDGAALWLQVEVNGTVLGCEEILPVPFALTLRPGAQVGSATTTTYGGMLTAQNGTDLVARLGAYDFVPLPTPKLYTYGVWAKGGTAGVYGESISSAGYGGSFNNTGGGPGVYARAGSDGSADLVLGGNSSTYDNGVLASDPDYSSSDLVFRSNDQVRIDLNDDNSAETGGFEIRDGADNLVFYVQDTGRVKSAADTYLFVHGDEVKDYGNANLTIKYYQVYAEISTSATGAYAVVLPVPVPAVLYGQAVQLKGIRVYFNTVSNQNSITRVRVSGVDTDGTPRYYLDQTVSWSNVGYTWQDLTISATSPGNEPGTAYLDSTTGLLHVYLELNFGTTASPIRLSGVRLTLGHQ